MLLGVQLVWSPDRRRGPVFPLQLVVEWDSTGGWSYALEQAEDGPRTSLTASADAEAAAVPGANGDEASSKSPGIAVVRSGQLRVGVLACA
ncbi:hypothetical protein BU198_23420 [Streptomyces sp. CBMA156]|nr:hypothetical protein [Streptomyces sp. CBMA156]